METQQPNLGEQAPMAPKPPMNEEQDIQQNKIWALLSYFGVLCLIPLLLKKDSKFAQFHAKQGLVMFIIEFFLWIPIIGWLAAIAMIFIWIMAVIKTLQGQYWKAPIIGDIAEKINI